MPNPFQSDNPQQTQGPSDFGNQFLQGVDEADRAIVAKYINQWDGNVTKKFQELQGKISSYEGLGDVNDLMAAKQLMADIQANPLDFYNNYRQYLVDNADNIQQQYQIENLLEALGVNMDGNGGMDQTGLPEYEGLPEAFVNEFRSMKDALEQMGGQFSQFQQQTTEQENLAMLDSVMENLHNEHGDFNDKFVLSQIAAGLSPEDAIAAWNEVKESIISSQKPAPPKLLTGPSATVLDQVDKTKLMDPSARKQLGAQLLSGLSQGG